VFHTAFLESIRDDQSWGCANQADSSRHQVCTDPVQEQGSVPDVSPYSTGPYGGFPGSPVWQSALVVIAREHWRHYGDKATLEANWAGLVSFMDYLVSVCLLCGFRSPRASVGSDVITGGLDRIVSSARLLDGGVAVGGLPTPPQGSRLGFRCRVLPLLV
jgi:hypothetical protein